MISLFNLLGCAPSLCPFPAVLFTSYTVETHKVPEPPGAQTFQPEPMLGLSLSPAE